MKWILAKFTKEWTQNSIEYATQKKIIKDRELCKKDNEMLAQSHGLRCL